MSVMSFRIIALKYTLDATTICIRRTIKAHPSKHLHSKEYYRNELVQEKEIA